MDPNATLQAIRDLCTEPEPDPEDFDELASLVEALDTWLLRGGALPRAWQRPD